ncbi:hypothetical protein K9M79_04725 [Candidatus Woesearchaeota archaeon]|nr:hypothetical protein [Candidatus Woesearchaeota archaeon]
MNEYYDTTAKKIVDFLIGFFGVIIFLVLMYGLAILISINYDIDQYLLMFFLLVDAIIPILVGIISFPMKRMYIGIGIFSSYLIPLLIGGACFIALIGLSSTGGFF